VSQLFEYAAWFRDSMFEPDDEDYEWPAVFIVVAPTAMLAQEWGDALAKSFSERREDQQYLWSSVEIADDQTARGLPNVAYGEVASDDFIGW
jgi:hypothetical protein